MTVALRDEILRLLARGMSQDAVAASVGIDQKVVSKVKRGVHWTSSI